jgi:hypothetical protein
MAVIARKGRPMRLAVLTLVAMALAAPAEASDEGRRVPVIVDVVPEVEAIGCYWKQGRQYCARYCYYEVNGIRYCHTRAREAYPQGPVPEIEYYPMKLGAGRRNTTP